LTERQKKLKRVDKVMGGKDG